MSKYQRNPGRVRERLAALLAEKGIIVDPSDLWTQEGGYRRVTWDLARWGSSSAKWATGKDPNGKPWGLPLTLSSWSTMSECVRYGITIGNFDDKWSAWGHVAVEHARQPGA